MKTTVPKLIAFGLMAIVVATSAAQNTPDPLKSGFQSPPQSARPRVWWHWMNGNISKEGIKLDLEWMHRTGLGGFQNFDAALTTPQVVEHRLAYMTQEWKDAFQFATTLADQMGMEEAIAGSPGWSESGGPWVPSSQAMKKYVWSETFVEGGKPFSGKLVQPPSATGPFQNIIIRRDPGDTLPAVPIRDYYADSVVVAFRATSDVSVASLHTKITASGGEPTARSVPGWSRQGRAVEITCRVPEHPPPPRRPQHPQRETQGGQRNDPGTCMV